MFLPLRSETRFSLGRGRVGVGVGVFPALLGTWNIVLIVQVQAVQCWNMRYAAAAMRPIGTLG